MNSEPYSKLVSEAFPMLTSGLPPATRKLGDFSTGSASIIAVAAGEAVASPAIEGEVRRITAECLAVNSE
jgi:hypothetical protein